jgi:hypothetical protein
MCRAEPGSFHFNPHTVSHWFLSLVRSERIPLEEIRGWSRDSSTFGRHDWRHNIKERKFSARTDDTLHLLGQGHVTGPCQDQKTWQPSSFSTHLLIGTKHSLYTPTKNPIYVFLFWEVRGPKSQCPHSCVCERFVNAQDWSTYFPAAECWHINRGNIYKSLTNT